MYWVASAISRVRTFATGSSELKQRVPTGQIASNVSEFPVGRKGGRIAVWSANEARLRPRTAC